MTTCLIVEDSPVIRKAIRMMLKDFAGFVIEEAENGQEALAFCAHTSPDFIILDWNMPVMGGIEFLKALHRQAPDPFPKVIFCTTENSFSCIEEALANGADEYIMKPFDKTVVEEKLTKIGIL